MNYTMDLQKELKIDRDRYLFQRLKIEQQRFAARVGPLHADEYIVKIGRVEYEQIVELALEALQARLIKEGL